MKLANIQAGKKGLKLLSCNEIVRSHVENCTDFKCSLVLSLPYVKPHVRFMIQSLFFTLSLNNVRPAIFTSKYAFSSEDFSEPTQQPIIHWLSHLKPSKQIHECLISKKNKRARARRLVRQQGLLYDYCRCN